MDCEIQYNSLLRLDRGYKIRKEDSSMRKYETIFILQPDLTEEVVQTISSKVEETIAAGNGHYVRLEDWGTH